MYLSYFIKSSLLDMEESGEKASALIREYAGTLSIFSHSKASARLLTLCSCDSCRLQNKILGF